MCVDKNFTYKWRNFKKPQWQSKGEPRWSIDRGAKFWWAQISGVISCLYTEFRHSKRTKNLEDQKSIFGDMKRISSRRENYFEDQKSIFVE